MTIKRFALAAVVAALPFSLGSPVGAFHSSTCSTSGLKALASPQTGTLTKLGQTHAYKLTLSVPGDHYLVALGVGGDADVTVCKSGSTTEWCTSTNMMPAPEGCVAPGLRGNPGVDKPLRGPGTYRVMIRHCFALDPDAGGCDYSLGSAPDDTVPVTPIAYVIAVQ